MAYIVTDFLTFNSYKRKIDNNKSATKELMNCSEGTVVYHTANENITIEVKNIRRIRCAY